MVDSAASLHQRRVANELAFLEVIAAANPGIVALLKRQIRPDSATVEMEFTCTPGVIESAGVFRLESRHRAEVHFPRFFPAVPIEARLAIPVLHPNVDPENGFTCLWDRFSEADTSVEVVVYLRNVITWRMFNLHASHVLQPRAIAWYQEPNRGFSVPFKCPELVIPPELGLGQYHPLPVRAKKPRIVL